MTGQASGALDIVPYWGRMNDTIIQLVDYIPGDKLNWSPKPELWNFKGILLHVVMVRHNWLANRVKDGAPTPDTLHEGQTREGMKEQLRLSWRRLERFLRDPARLAATYAVEYEDGEMVTGHWIAYHLLEHDVHHRADIFHYLALLDIEHPDVETP